MGSNELECQHPPQVGCLPLLSGWTAGLEEATAKGGPGPRVRIWGEALLWIWWTGEDLTLVSDPGAAGLGLCRNYLEVGQKD